VRKKLPQTGFDPPDRPLRGELLYEMTYPGPQR
jgi:hypothetical protein